MVTRPAEVVVSSRVAAMCAELAYFRSQRMRAEKREAELKAGILEALDYSPDDPKPQPVTCVDMNEHPIFEVRIGKHVGHDVAWIKAHHPDVWALSETVKPTQIIKILDDVPEFTD